MAQAAWHSYKHTYQPNRGNFLRGFKPPSEQVSLAIAIGIVIAAVFVLQLRGAVRPRTEDAGIAIDTTGYVVAPAAAPETRVGPLLDPSVAPPPAVIAQPEAAPRIVEPAPVVIASAPAGAPALPASIRTVNLAALPAVRNLETQTGARFDPSLATYGDLAGAGDALLLPLQSGGSAGALAVALLANGADGPQVLALLTPDATSRGSIRARFDGGNVVTTSAVLGPEDALCCPSHLRYTTYAWDGSRLVAAGAVTIENPRAKD